MADIERKRRINNRFLRENNLGDKGEKIRLDRSLSAFRDYVGGVDYLSLAGQPEKSQSGKVG